MNNLFDLMTHRLMVLVAIFTITMSGTANAYVDPGSGGVLITAILGFFAAIGYTFRKWFYKLKSIFVGPTNDDEDDE